MYASSSRRHPDSAKHGPCALPTRPESARSRLAPRERAWPEHGGGSETAVSMYICTCVYTYSVYICVYVYVHVCIYVYMIIHFCLFICSMCLVHARKYISTCVDVYTHTYIHTYIRTYIHTYMHAYYINSCALQYVL